MLDLTKGDRSTSDLSPVHFFLGSDGRDEHEGYRHGGNWASKAGTVPLAVLIIR